MFFSKRDGDRVMDKKLIIGGVLVGIFVVISVVGVVLV